MRHVPATPAIKNDNPLFIMPKISRLPHTFASSYSLGDAVVDINIVVGERQELERYENALADLKALLTGYIRLRGEVTLGGSLKPGPQLASCEAVWFTTNTPTLYDEMDEISQPCLDMARAIFHNHGYLQPWFATPPPGHGSAVWEHRLSYANLLLIDYLHVESDYRRQGIARRLIDALLEATRAKIQPDYWYAVALPSVLWTSQLRTQSEQLSIAELQNMCFDHTQRSIAFFRALAFRRVGDSVYFAWSADAEHPSRLLDAADDYDP